MKRPEGFDRPRVPKPPAPAAPVATLGCVSLLIGPPLPGFLGEQLRPRNATVLVLVLVAAVSSPPELPVPTR
ncbi:hypothetical protein [Clavibacter michiganensis]|uniref:hypothetical protein n=1 Tax=Clavibacter michiganensis TaxID=28447 RepID=UPI00292F460F|nr:hypothetical protein [Clavibacter michiganensis]